MATIDLNEDHFEPTANRSPIVLLNFRGAGAPGDRTIARGGQLRRGRA